MVLGFAALYFFLIFFNIAGEFLVNTAGFIIPAYYSLDALFSSSKTDDTQWLTVRLNLQALRMISPCNALMTSYSTG